MKKKNHFWQRTRLALMVLAVCQLPIPALAADGAHEYLLRADEFASKGDLSAAVIEMKNALQVDPSHAEARRMLGRTYLLTGDANSAEKELRRASALGIDTMELHLDLAEALLRLERYDEAMEHLEPLPEDDPLARARAIMLRGYIEVGQKKPALGRASFQQALELDPGSKKAAMGLLQLEVREGNLQVALESLDKVLEKYPNDAKSLLLKGDLQRQLGRPEEALAAFGGLLAVEPKNIQALLARITVNLSLSRVDAAKTDLDLVDQINSDIVMARYFRAVLAFQDKRLEEAREHVQAVLGTIPSHAPSQLIYGLVAYGMGDYEVAEEFLGRFGPGTSAYPLAVKTLGAARLRTKQPGQAINILEPLLHDYPNDLKLLLLLGNAYLQQGEHVKSAELLQRAVELKPETAQYRTQLAMGLLGSGKTEEAVEQLKSAVELDAELVQADVLLVTTHLKNNEVDEALQASLALEKRMPENPVAYNLTGLVYLTQNQLDEASQRFEQALSVDPDFTIAETNLARIDMLRKDSKAAETRYQRTLKAQPGNLTALIGLAGIANQVGDEDGMVQWLETAIEKNPKKSQPVVLLGRYYLGSGQSLKALSVANNAITRMANDPGILEVLARSQAATGEMNSAVRTFQRLVNISPRMDFYLLLAAAQVATEDTLGARSSLDTALILQPESPAVKLAMASVAVKEKDYNSALVLAQELQSAHPKMEQAHRLEGAVRLQMGQPSPALDAYKRAYEMQATAESARQLAHLYEKTGRTEDAIAAMRDWTQANPDDLPMRMVLAVSYQKWDRVSEAVVEYEAILQEEEKNPVLLNNLAWLYFEQNDPRALDMAKRAYDIDPQRAEIADTYGWILLKQDKQADKALTVLQAAYVTAPTNNEIGYHVAEALHALGRSDEALRTLRRLLDGGAEFPQRKDAEQLRRSMQMSDG